MDKEVNQMFKLILDKFDSLETKFDRVETKLENVEVRLTSLENEFKEFRIEMKEELKRTDGKIDLIYNKLSNDIEEIKNKPEPKFKIVREL